MIVKTVPFLGLEWHIQLLEFSNDNGFGVTTVQRVVPNSPAARAGVQIGDVIRSVDGTVLTDQATLTDQISRKKPGSVVTLEVVRNGKKTNIKVTLGERQLPAYRFRPVTQRSLTDKG